MVIEEGPFGERGRSGAGKEQGGGKKKRWTEKWKRDVKREKK